VVAGPGLAERTAHATAGTVLPGAARVAAMAAAAANLPVARRARLLARRPVRDGP